MEQDDICFECARVAEHAEMHEKMAECMKTLVERTNGNLKREARNLLSVAYKNVVGSRRTSWRVVKGIIEKLEKEEEDERVDKEKAQAKRKLTEDFLNDIVTELNAKCEEVVELLDKFLLIAAQESEEKMFYYKMKGDYYRYLAEVKKEGSDDRKEICEKSLEAYKKATDEGANLSTTHPVLLGTKLNFSVFYYEILNQPEKACELAKAAFDNAIGELDGLPEESYKDSTLIMQLLRDNLTLWTTEVQGEKDED